MREITAFVAFDESKQRPSLKSISVAQLFRVEHEVIRKWAEGFIDRDNNLCISFNRPSSHRYKECVFTPHFNNSDSYTIRHPANCYLGNAVSPRSTPGSFLTRSLFPLHRHVP